MKHLTIDDKILITQFSNGLMVVTTNDHVQNALIGTTITVTVNEARKLLRDLTKKLESFDRRIYDFSSQRELDILQEFIIQTFDIKDPLGLNSPIKNKENVVGRQLFFSILKWNGYGTYSKIGKTLKKSWDHTTVMYSEEKIKNYIQTKDPLYYKLIMKVLDFYCLPIPK